MLGINAIKITQETLIQIADIDEFKGLWTGLERHTTGLNLLGDVADYGAKFGRVLDPLREHPLTIDMIRILHASQNNEKSAAAIKTSVNKISITSQGQPVGMLETAAPEDVTPLLSKLCEWVNDEINAGKIHPLLVIAVFTSVFLQIAPFDDHNQRTVRFLMTLLLMKAGYTYAPYASLGSVMDERAREFYAALSHNQNSLEAGKPDWAQWLNFLLSALQSQKQELYDRLYAKEADLKNIPALSVKIMALFKEHQRLQMHDIIKLTRGRRATIKLRLNELIDAGYLKRHGQGRGTWYSLN